MTESTNQTKTFRFSLIRFFGLLFAIGLIILAAGYLYIEQQLPNVDRLKQIQFQVPLRIFTKDKKLISEFGDKRRIPVNIDQIPKLLIQAVLATEDQRFYKHPGIDPVGLLRASWQLILTGEKEQGGSTITMQVARNFFLTRKKTFTRKFKEILLAIKIDKELSKEKILALYLNKIYLGNRAYGVGAAAQIYYGKPLNELTLGQMAMIAGLPKAPSAINPIANPEAAYKRRNHVLTRMYEQHKITALQFTEADNEPIKTHYHGLSTTVNAPYVAEMVRSDLLKDYGDAIYTMGLNVYTTLNSDDQMAANQSLQEGLLAYTQRHGYRGPLKQWGKPGDDVLPQWQDNLTHISTISYLQPAAITSVDDTSAQALLKNGDLVTIPWSSMQWARQRIRDPQTDDVVRLGLFPKTPYDVLTPGDVVRIRFHNNTWQLTQIPKIQGSLVALNPNDGAIKALVGGFNFSESNFNRVIQATRQPGSAFKPFIYSAALAKGFTLATIINDAPIVLNDVSAEQAWRPKNDSRHFYGPTRLREGLTHSRNLVSIRLLQLVGISFTRDYIHRFGFPLDQIPETLSLALGSGTVTPLQLAAGYSVFANGGYRITPYFVDHITNSQGKILYQATPAIACQDCQAQDLSNTTEPLTPLAPSVITARNAYLITKGLQDVIQHGTGRRARVLHRSDLSGKTGTTNDQNDAWFAGFNRDLVTVAWVGFDQNQSIFEYGSKVALPIWIDFMKIALKGKPEHSMQQPDGIITMLIDKKTGSPVSTGQTNTTFEYFRQEYAPQRSNGPTLTKPSIPTTHTTSPANDDEPLF